MYFYHPSTYHRFSCPQSFSTHLTPLPPCCRLLLHRPPRLSPLHSRFSMGLKVKFARVMARLLNRSPAAGWARTRAHPPCGLSTVCMYHSKVWFIFAAPHRLPFNSA